MSEAETWSKPVSLAKLNADHFKEPGTVFEWEDYHYRTTGREIGTGGMGSVFLLSRRPSNGSAESEPVVGKVFHAEYLYQLRTDEITRNDHESVIRNIEKIQTLHHPNLLETYVSTPIDHNHLTVCPHKCETLLQAISTRRLSSRQRLELLAQALRGTGGSAQATTRPSRRHAAQHSRRRTG